MDLVDQFVRDGVFGNDRHEHFFKKGESKAIREASLREIDKTCNGAGIAYVVREVKDRNRNPGYEFGFADKITYAAFVLNVGDLKKPRGHVHCLEFGAESLEERETFLLAAESHLAALGIEHDWRVQNGEMQFACDRFSERTIFEALVEKGIIRDSAQGLALARAFQRRLGVNIPHPCRSRLRPGLTRRVMKEMNGH